MFFSNLNVFSATAQQLKWAAARQQVLNRNMALANVPGAQALDLVPLNTLGKPITLKPTDEDNTLKKSLSNGSFKTFLLKGSKHLSGNTIDAEEQLKLMNENALFNKQVLSIRQKFSEIVSMII